MIQIELMRGDVSKVPADALITAINSGGMWFGGIDGVIMRAAGELFHSQAERQMPLKDGQAVVATSNGHAHRGAFTNVVFVVDDLQRKLREIVYNGLKAASEAGFKTVTIPAIRMGVMLGVVEATINEAVTEIATGVRAFVDENPGTSLQKITFVIYNDQKAIELLQRALPR